MFKRTFRPGKSIQLTIAPSGTDSNFISCFYCILYFEAKKEGYHPLAHKLHRVSVIWSSDIWSFWLYFGYMVNGQSDFSTKFFGYMVISAVNFIRTKTWTIYIPNPV